MIIFGFVLHYSFLLESGSNLIGFVIDFSEPELLVDPFDFTVLEDPVESDAG